MTGRLALALLTLAAAPVRAQDLVAVLSSDSVYYREAFEGFFEALGRAVPAFTLPEEPRVGRARVVAAFGSRATLQAYPAGTVVVHSLALGVQPPAGGRTVAVWAMPAPEAVLEGMRRVQPGLRRLGVYWSSPGMRPYLERLRRAARAAGVRLVIERLGGPDGLPDALRRSAGRVDALWVPSDPLLLDARSFETLCGFSSGNRVPFYVSAHGLAEKGAAASFSVGFREVGRLQAAAARQALEGGAPEAVYPPVAETTVNLTAARAAGLEVPEEALRSARKVVP